MSGFHVRTGEVELGPLSAEELRARRVGPDELVRHGEAGPWAHLSSLIARGGDARDALEDAVDPDAVVAEPWRERSIMEVTWPIMLLAADALWFFRAASPSTAVMVGAAVAASATGLALRRPWAWPLAALTCAAAALWLLTPVIIALSPGFALWVVLNVAVAVFLWVRRPRGTALDWPRRWRRLLLIYSADPASESRPLRRRRDRAGWVSALAGLAVFFGVVLSAVALYHALRYPGREMPIGLVPHGTDLAARSIAVGVYGFMVALAVLFSLRGRAVAASLGLERGLGWRRAGLVACWAFLALLVALLGGRWALRAVELVEQRVATPTDAYAARVRTAAGQVRSAVEDVHDRVQSRRSFSLQNLLFLVLGLLVAPVCEEFLFRGLVFGALRRSIPFWAAALLSAAAFAGGHGWGLGWGLAGPVLWLQIFAGGIAAAWAYERSGTLAAPIVFHVLWNAAQTVTQATSA
jgi:membrane protease YdiL (CAAX protease family)